MPSTWRGRLVRPSVAGMICGLVSAGGAEFVFREVEEMPPLRM